MKILSLNRIAEILSVALTPIIFSSCQKNPKTGPKIDPAPSYRGIKLDEMPKVPLVELIYSVADVAIEQSWSKQTWIIRLGQPTSMQEHADDMIILDYRDWGPFQPPIARFFLSGASIKLVGDKTVDISYVHTETN